LENSSELKAVAAEFAEERAEESKADSQEPSQEAPAEPAASESGIIPLLDESDAAPGLPESQQKTPQLEDDDLPVGLALEEDHEVEPRPSLDVSSSSAKGERNGAPPGSAREKSRKDENAKSRKKSGTRSRR
jgi:hypothetical protein